MTFKRCVDYCDSVPETKAQKAQRWTSIRIIYMTMFFDSLSFSLVLASLWPYLQKVNQGAELNPIYVGIAGVSFHVSVKICFITSWSQSSLRKFKIIRTILLLDNLYTYEQSAGNIQFLSENSTHNPIVKMRK